MPMPQAADTMPMVSLSTPLPLQASGTSGKATPACRPMAAQAAKTGRSARQGLAATALLGDTQMALGAERRRLLDLSTWRSASAAASCWRLHMSA